MKKWEVDTIRMHYTYGIALLMLLGAFTLLLVETPGITGGEKLAFIAGFVTGIVGFVFNRESQTGATRAAERAVALGANTATPPNPPPAPPAPAGA